MESKSVKVAAVENADARLKEITTRMCISAIADYDAGLIQGFIDGANWARKVMFDYVPEWIHKNSDSIINAYTKKSLASINALHKNLHQSILED